VRRLLDLQGKELLGAKLEDEFLATVPSAARTDAASAFGEAATEHFNRWIRHAWRSVRELAPDLRGFVSEHDTIWLVNLDTGETVRDEDIGLGYL
ncbi:MAG: hypothetical protein ACXVEE_38845, partial [Polyangiales bacterium]